MHKKLHEVGGRTLFDEKFRDRVSNENNEWRTETWFGRHKEMMREIGRILSDLKTSGQKEFVINEFGPGRDRKKGYLTYEIFELINQAERAGIKPEELTVYVYDRVMPSLIAVLETKKIVLDNTEQLRIGDPAYIKEFFPTHQRVSGDEAVIVEIDIGWRGRIRTFHENLQKTPAEKKADVTFACLQVGEHEINFKNLVESTRVGGFLVCNPTSEDNMRNFKLEKVFQKDYAAMYRRCE